MIINKDRLGLKDIADCFDKAPNVIANWINRDENFPQPYSTTASGKLWKAEDIAEYAKNKGFDLVALPDTQGATGRVAIVGRARMGKSFLVAILARSRTEYAKVFCDDGTDKTVCPIHNFFIDADFREYFTFRTNFGTVFGPEFDKDEQIKQIKDKLDDLGRNHYYYFDCLDAEEGTDKDEILRDIHKIESIVKSINAVEASGKYQNLRSETYLETFIKPGTFLRNIMRDTSKKKLEVIDTPGVSGSVAATAVEKADLFILMLKSENAEEAQTLKRIVEQIRPYTATSKVVFLYKKEGVFLNEKKYALKRDEIRHSVQAFEPIFEELRGPIISTDMEILRIADNAIMFPTMDIEVETLAEEQFLKDIKEKLVSALNETASDDVEYKAFSEIVKTQGPSAVQFVLNLLKGIPPHNLQSNDKDYTEDLFKAEAHDRVLSGDHLRVYNDAASAYKREVEKLYGYFSQFRAEDINEDWKQLAIRHVYHVLSKSARTDRGIGVGAHPWERTPPLTMLVEESIHAKTVLDYLEGVEPRQMSGYYRDALKNAKISSSSWYCVGCNDDSNDLEKLKIISEMLIDVPVSTREDMILCRYVGGLRKSAELEILRELGLNERRCYEELRALPF